MYYYIVEDCCSCNKEFYMLFFLPNAIADIPPVVYKIPFSFLGDGDLLISILAFSLVTLFTKLDTLGALV